jgi:hypothetical protein
MEDRDEADVNAEVFRISSDLFRDREHHVEARYPQQVGLTIVEPLCPGKRPAPGTVAIPTRGVHSISCRQRHYSIFT